MLGASGENGEGGLFDHVPSEPFSGDVAKEEHFLCSQADSFVARGDVTALINLQTTNKIFVFILIPKLKSFVQEDGYV